MTELGAPRIRLWHGWQRAPLEPWQDGPDDPRSGYPYFGILPRALLAHTTAEDGAPLDVQDWSRIAPLLERALVSPEAARQLAPQALGWLEAARAKGVLSIAQAAQVCSAFVADLALTRQLGVSSSIDLWLIKEGHTSSVWRCELEGSGRSSVFAVNVSRDLDAGAELAASYSQLQAWHESDPDHVAQPLALDRREFPTPDGTWPVVVTAHAWAEGRELHARPKASAIASTLDAEFLEIEGFVPDSATGQLRALARVLDPWEQHQAWDELIGFLERHRHVDAHGRTQVPALEVNDGDLVRCSSGLVIVAASAAPRELSADEWQRFVASPYLNWGPGGPRLQRPVQPRA